MSQVLVENGPDAGAIWHFGEPNQEQKYLAQGKAWADLSHRAIISICGADRLTWLHALTTQHLEKLAPNTWKEALILDPNGHIEQQFFLVDDGECTWLHLDSEKKGELLSYLEKMKFMMRVKIADRSNEYTVIRDVGISDDIGGPFLIIKRSELAEKCAKLNEVASQVGIWAIEAERVAARRARVLFETDHKSIPNELGFLNRAVHMNKGCYRGQETVAKVFNLGQPPRKLLLLHLDGSMVELPKSADRIELDGKDVGFIGTVVRHYELGPIALAVVKRNTPDDATLNIKDITATIDK
jgi:folate-binding protein YgfZ